MSKEKKIQIRNSTAEFLVFTTQAGEEGIEVRVEAETVWLTQKLIGVLFDKGRSTITEHLRNIFETSELDEKAVCRNFRHTAEDGKDYTTAYYNLDAIIAVGFRVNSARATQFRQWAIGILRDFAIRGYVLDKERLKNGAIFNHAYFDNLLAEIREIRASERRFYAEDQAERGLPMTMADWAKKLDAFLQFNERDLLDHPGKVTAEIAKAFAESEFEKYRVVQDRLFESDFDRAIKQLPKEGGSP